MTAMTENQRTVFDGFKFPAKAAVRGAVKRVRFRGAGVGGVGGA